MTPRLTLRPFLAQFLCGSLFLCGSMFATLSADETKISAEQDEKSAATKEAAPVYTPKTKSELRRSLNRVQYDVTQNEATEPAFRNKYWDNKKEGTYRCVVCEQELFDSETKFKSGTGWPSFYQPKTEKVVGFRNDWRLIYTRVEVHCSRCGAHLGHVFDDGPEPTGKRYCMNSASFDFVETSKLAAEKDAKKD